MNNIYIIIIMELLNENVLKLVIKLNWEDGKKILVWMSGSGRLLKRIVSSYYNRKITLLPKS